MRKYAAVCFELVHFAQFAHQQPGGRVEPVEHNQQFHPQQVGRVAVVQVHPLVQQHRFAVLLIVFLREDDGPPPTEGLLSARTDDQPVAATLPDGTTAHQLPHTSMR